jgi:hypothetical protein
MHAALVAELKALRPEKTWTDNTKTPPFVKVPCYFLLKYSTISILQTIFEHMQEVETLDIAAASLLPHQQMDWFNLNDYKGTVL